MDTDIERSITVTYDEDKQIKFVNAAMVSITTIPKTITILNLKLLIILVFKIIVKIVIVVTFAFQLIFS